ncbi:MAG: hypothetical protein KA154_03920 [Gemmatimonadaceae bacterium]|nr:hypothetical protein [Gemmatimonadaceae bacterium]MCC6432120.1 hypothetical protein [Gemmatimonadaceae bacterium]
MSIVRVSGAWCLLLLLAACQGSDTGTVTGVGPLPTPTASLLRIVPASVETGAAMEMAMGDSLDMAVAVRVSSATGAPHAGVSVRFEMWDLSARDSVATGVSVPTRSQVAFTDQDGVAKPSGWRAPAADSAMRTVSIVASLDAAGAQSAVEYRIRAWRDLRRFGGTSPLVIDALPVDRAAVVAVLPLGTFRADDALPSADAILLLAPGSAHRVSAPVTGLITELDRADGTITLRVRDHVRVRLSGVEVRTDIWVGMAVPAGAPLGRVVARAVAAEVGIRVLDATAPSMQWINPERYGARRMTRFFARYLADSLRSEVYGLVRRSAPDLDGRIDYDRDGRLVGTWFDHSVPLEAAPLGPSPNDRVGLSHPSAVFAGVQASEIDPSASLNGLGLTFAYDAERPGQTRVAIGRDLAAALGVGGLHTVAWEDADPAEVDVTRGPVRYRLFDAQDEARVGRGDRVLLVQLLDATTLRVEAVDARDAERATFSSRAVTLVR